MKTAPLFGGAVFSRAKRRKDAVLFADPFVALFAGLFAAYFAVLFADPFVALFAVLISWLAAG